MMRWVALLRGINVGSNRKMPMKQLTALLESLGCAQVRTYIQSGNVVFDSPCEDRAALRGQIEGAAEAGFGFRPATLLLTQAELMAAIDDNPFPEAAEAPKLLHLFFLEAAPEAPDLAALEAQAAQGERFALLGQVFYLHTPAGFGTSKLAGLAERKLRVAATARNYNTVQALAAMLA